MTDTAQRNRPETPGDEPSGSGELLRKTSASTRGGGAPASRGRTTIADGVVEKIAGLAAREVIGVHATGSGFSRTFGAVRDRVPGGGRSTITRGVKAEVGEV